MNVIQISIFILICLFCRFLKQSKWFESIILSICFFTLFLLQPISAIRTLDFWIPAVSIAIGVVSWIFVVDRKYIKNKENLITLIFSTFFIIFLGLIRFIPGINIQSVISIPNLFSIIIFIAITSLLVFAISIIKNKKFFSFLFIGLLIGIFILTKNEYLAFKTSVFLRSLSGQSLKLAASNEIVYLGYSYFAFRMIHAIIESNKKDGFQISLRSYLIYLFYFPSFLAGPIAKIDDFSLEMSSNRESTKTELINGGERIAIGLFQKFIIADTLAIISMNKSLSLQTTTAGWMWIFVFAYSFRIYFDFNGYTHIALGLSQILGIKLPENFNKPLRSPTLAIFWNNWHITLTQWFRGYYFNPLTRYIKTRFRSINQQFLMAFMQITTMLLIGLWHGINFNFLIWGAWNGLGLFLQNKISGFLFQKIGQNKPFWHVSKFTKLVSISLTFVFISLGWVWFALSSLESSLHVFRILFGLS